MVSLVKDVVDAAAPPGLANQPSALGLRSVTADFELEAAARLVNHEDELLEAGVDRGDEDAVVGSALPEAERLLGAAGDVELNDVLTLAAASEQRSVEHGQRQASLSETRDE